MGPRDAAWGPVGPSVGQWTCVSRPEATGGLYHKDNEMNEDVFNGSIRKFLKTLGVSGQREIVLLSDILESGEVLNVSELVREPPLPSFQRM